MSVQAPYPTPTLRAFHLETEDPLEAVRSLRAAMDDVILLADAIGRMSQVNPKNPRERVVFAPLIDELRIQLTNLLNYQDVPWDGFVPRRLLPSGAKS